MKIKKTIGIIAIFLALALGIVVVTSILNIAKDRDKNEETKVPSTTEPVITGPTISGAWVFDKPTNINEAVTYSVSFESNGEAFSSIKTEATGDFDLFYDEIRVVTCYGWLDSNEGNISPYMYVDFGDKPQAVSAEFIEFMETNASKAEVSGKYCVKDTTSGVSLLDKFSINFTYDGREYIGFNYSMETGDPVYYFDSASSEDLMFGHMGSWDIDPESVVIDFGETPQSVSFECWRFFHYYLTKVS